jgi:hypothetical protein
MIFTLFAAVIMLFCFYRAVKAAVKNDPPEAIMWGATCIIAAFLTAYLASL